ncbi:hypothetical protein, partial [Brevibacterium sp. Mu109]|uniref:hypothetical protein n=1 Tax=Brevibacterium sp. Mu109 TaxID=1255669 RepID=UPI001C60B490
QQINNWHHQKQTNTLLSSQRTDTQTDPTRHKQRPALTERCSPYNRYSQTAHPDIHAPFPLRSP